MMGTRPTPRTAAVHSLFRPCAPSSSTVRVLHQRSEVALSDSAKWHPSRNVSLGQERCCRRRRCRSQSAGAVCAEWPEAARHRISLHLLDLLSVERFLGKGLMWSGAFLCTRFLYAGERMP